MSEQASVIRQRRLSSRCSHEVDHVQCIIFSSLIILKLYGVELSSEEVIQSISLWPNLRVQQLLTEDPKRRFRRFESVVTFFSIFPRIDIIGPGLDVLESIAIALKYLEELMISVFETDRFFSHSSTLSIRDSKFWPFRVVFGL